jgi:hypothetical protein
LKTKRIAPYAAGLLACGSALFTASAADAGALEEAPSRPLYRSWALGLEAGTTGVGGSLSWRFADHWGVRAGIDYLGYTDSGFPINGISYDAEIRVMSEPLTLDIYPWKTSSFHISAGLQFNQNRLAGTADATEAGLGELNLKIEQQPVNPYLSIGGNFFYFDRAHHWAMGGELGVAYTGDPEVSLTSSSSGPGIDAALGAVRSGVEDYANKFRWWPVVKLGVSYSF